MATSHDNATLLGGCEILGELPEAELARVARLARRRTWSAGDPVFFQDDDPDALYVVCSGQVRVTVSSEDGDELELNRLGPGSVFGEIGLLDGEPRTAGVTAHTDAELLILDRARFLALLQEHPRLAISLVELLCRRMRHASTRIEEEAFLGVEARLARYLLRMVRRHGVEDDDGVRIDARVPQAEIAASLGVSRQTVNKHLRALQDDDVLEIGRARLVVLSTHRLRRLAQLA